MKIEMKTIKLARFLTLLAASLLSFQGIGCAASIAPEQLCDDALDLSITSANSVVAPKDLLNTKSLIIIHAHSAKPSANAVLDYKVNIYKPGIKHASIFQITESAHPVSASSAKLDFAPIKVQWQPSGSSPAVPEGHYLITVAAKLKDKTGAIKKAQNYAESSFLVTSSPALLSLKAGGKVTLASTSDKPTNDALVANFPYKFYFGGTHAHTAWSDGGTKCADCNGPVTSKYHQGADPEKAYKYAEDHGLDFLAVVEHNHVMDDVFDVDHQHTAKDIADRYHLGVQQAKAATKPGKFVGIFGMEWGEISKGGHVNVYNQPQLISWTTAPASGNHPAKRGLPADVKVGFCKYTELYSAVVNNQPAGSKCVLTLNHPKAHDFEEFSLTDDAKRVVRGIAIMSGPADSNAENYDDTVRLNKSGYRPQFVKALLNGWKVAPEAHQDNHCWNYGTSTTARTVAVLPAGDQLSLTKLMDAFDARHFYASSDRNAQLKFATKDNAHIMGDSFESAGPVNVTAQIADPDNEDLVSLTLWSGKIGGSKQLTDEISVDGESDIKKRLEPHPGEEWFYFIEATQKDDDKIYSAPIWIDWQS